MRNLITHWSLLTLAVLFTLWRLLFLSRLPLFNDESIYLDWGWKETHVPGALFYSLVDGKPPLLMWLFGISQSIVSDPLIAGRIISVGAGLVTFIGLYKLAEAYFTKKIAVISALLYLVIPIFTMYDRLALMESSISACGVWSLYYYLKVVKGAKIRDSVILGVILGVGFFIKSNALLFLITMLLMSGYFFFRYSAQKPFFAKAVITTFCVFLITVALLFIQPLYWQTLSMNSRYSMTVSELLHFPVLHTLQNLLVNVQILFFFVTPIVFLAICYGIILLVRKKNLTHMTIVAWSLLLFVLQTVLVRNTTQRYLVSFLPVFLLFAAFAFNHLVKRCNAFIPILAIALFGLPLLLTSWQMVDPHSSNQFSQRLTEYTDSGLTVGQTSGYGISEIVTKLKSLTNSQPAYIATAINIGNPESAIPLYFHNSESVRTGFFDRRMFGDSLSGYQCLSSPVPVYYVSRDQQQSDMNAYLEEIYRVKQPSDDYSLGIYQLKSSCDGKTLTFNPFQ